MTSLEVRSEDASILFESASAKVEQTQGLHTAVTKEWGKVGGQLRYAKEKFTVFHKSLENLDADIAALGRLASDNTKKVDEGLQVLRHGLRELTADAAAKYEQAESSAITISSPRTTAQLFRFAREQADTLTEAATLLDALTAARDDIAAFAHKLQNSANAVSKLIERSKSVQDTSQGDLVRLDNSLQTTISPCVDPITTAKPSGECRKAGREGIKRFQASVRDVTMHLAKESELSSALTRETRKVEAAVGELQQSNRRLQKTEHDYREWERSKRLTVTQGRSLLRSNIKEGKALAEKSSAVEKSILAAADLARAMQASDTAAQASLRELTRSLESAQRAAEQTGEALERAREAGHREAAKYLPVASKVKAQSSTKPAAVRDEQGVPEVKRPEPPSQPVRAMPKEATDGGLRFQYGASAMISAP